MLMLRFDGEIWEVASGEGPEGTNVTVRPAKGTMIKPEAEHQQKAIDLGISLIQTSYGGLIYHEVRRIS